MYQISVPYQRKYFFVDLSLDDNDSDHEEVVSQDVASLPVTSTMPSSSSSTISDNHITFPSIALPELAGENARNVFSHHNNSIVGSAEEEEEEEEAKELNSAIVVDEIDCKFKNRLPANTQSWNADINIFATKAEIMPTASPVVQYSTTTCSDRKRSSFPEGHELGPQNKRQNTGSTKFTAASSAPSTKLPPSFPLPPSLPPPSPKVKKSIRFQEDTALLHIKEFCKWKPLETFLAKDPYEKEMSFLISTCQEYMYNGIVQQDRIDRQSFFPNMITYVDYLRKKLRLSLKHSLHGYLSNFKIELEDYEKVIKPIGNNQSISSDMKPFVEFNIVSSNNCKPMQDLVQCVLVIKKDAIPHSETKKPFNYHNYKAVSHNVMCYGVLYPANLSKPICSCNFCKKGGGVNGINTQDSHYLLRLPNDSSKTYCNGMNLHAIYCIPMGGIDARAVLLQHRIVHSALFFKNFCYRGLSLGNSTIRSYHIKYIMQQAFDANLPLKPEEYLLKVIEDLLQTPIRKITIIQERIIPQLESFYQVHQTQFSHNLHLSFNRLFDKWKLIDKDESSDNINIPLDAAQCQALSEHFNISITFLKEIFHTLSKYSLSLHQVEIDDWNSIQDMLVLLIEMLSLIKANNRRILVCIKGNHVSPTDVFHNYPIYPKDHRCDHRMIRTSSSQSKTVSDASKGEAKPLSFVPKIRAGRDTFVYFTSYDSLVDSIIQDFNSPEFESGTDFDLVILVDPKRNMTELESIIPLSLFAKKLIILGGNSLDERKPNLFRILSKNLKPIVNQDKEGVRDNQAHVSKKAKYSHHYGPSHLNHLHPAAVRQHMKLQS